MIHQLRIYEIFDQNKEAFHNRFRDHAWRIMRSYGFNILGMWETRLGDRTEFVYLLAGRMKGQCDTSGNSSGPTKSGKRSRKSPMLNKATLSQKSRIEYSSPQAIVPLSMRHVSQESGSP